MLCCIMCLTGCFGQGSGTATSGVMKSEDGGRTFVPHNVIDAEHTIGRSDIYAMAVDPRNNNTVYAGSEKEDLFVSRDAAKTWSAMQTGLKSITDIAVSSQNSEDIYVSGMYNGRGSVIRTQDGGKNWERVYVEPQDGTNVTVMVMSPINANIVFIGTSGGTIARTNNGGSTWENVHKATSRIEALEINVREPSVIYALVSATDVIVSRDNGVKFENVRNMQRDTSVYKVYEGTAYSMTIEPQKAGSIIVGTDRGIFRSYDYGLGWEAIDVIASTVGLPIQTIAASPHGAQLVYAVAKAIYTSVENGWVITDTTSSYVVDVIVHDPVNPDIIYIGLKKSK